MKTVKNVLVAYDFSECSRRALLESVSFAERSGAVITVLNVIDANISEVFSKDLVKEWQDKTLKSISQDLAQVGKSESTKSLVKEVLVEIGVPYKKIIEKVLDKQIDLVIVGSHGRSALGYVLLGSVADKVVRYSPVPVMVCRLERARAFSKVLVPLDQDQASESAIGPAKYFAELYNSQIELLQVVDFKDVSFMNFQDVIEKLLGVAESRLKEVQSKHNLALHPVVLEGGVSYSIIEHVRQDAEVGLVAMMTHGRKGLKHFMLGSVAEAVIRYAPCNVLVIPTEEHSKKIHEIKDSFKSEKVTLGNILI